MGGPEAAPPGAGHACETGASSGRATPREAAGESRLAALGERGEAPRGVFNGSITRSADRVEPPRTTVGKLSAQPVGTPEPRREPATSSSVEARRGAARARKDAVVGLSGPPTELMEARKVGAKA